MNNSFTKILFTSSLFLLLNVVQASEQQVKYSIEITDAAHHLAEVTVLFPQTERSTVDLIMPVWRLGKYKILDLANGLRHFKVTDARGRELAVKKIDKNTWRVNLDRPSKLAVSYQLYANQLAYRARHIDDTHAYLDGASSFIYSPEFIESALTVNLDVPNGWRSRSGMKRLNKHSFAADNYNVLASSPIETGIHEYYSFSADDKKYEVVIWGKGNFDAKKIVKDYKAMVVEHGKMWQGYPFERYLFIIHATTDARGATEHINSTVIQRDAMAFSDEKDYKRFLSTSSHEFVHTWNVKAYRPEGIWKYDYTKENYSDLLWIAEGSTSYFSDLLLVRAELLKPEKYLEDWAKRIQSYLDRPGRKVMSAQQSSFDAWIEGGGDRANNASVNIYSKGNLLSLLMDIELLKATNADKGYAELHKLLYQRFPITEKGYSAQDIQNLLLEISGNDYSDFWKTMIESTDDIDFDSLFESVGLKFSHKSSNKKDEQQIWTGLKLTGNTIISVPEASPGWEAGLTSGDILVAINGMKVVEDKLSTMFKTFSAGDEVKVSFFRRNLLKETNMELASRSAQKLKLEHLKDASDQQKLMYEKWLGVSWPEQQDTKLNDK